MKARKRARSSACPAIATTSILLRMCWQQLPGPACLCLYSTTPESILLLEHDGYDQHTRCCHCKKWNEWMNKPTKKLSLIQVRGWRKRLQCLRTEDCTMALKMQSNRSKKYIMFDAWHECVPRERLANRRVCHKIYTYSDDMWCDWMAGWPTDVLQQDIDKQDFIQQRSWSATVWEFLSGAV